MKSKARGMYGEHMTILPTPYIDPLCGLDFSTPELSLDTSSCVVFHMLTEDISHCPVEGFPKYVSRILKARLKFLPLLSGDDVGRLTLGAVHHYEAKLGSGRTWSIKNAGILKCGKFSVTVSCRARGEIKPKERGSLDGKNQRDRESIACLCKRSATLSFYEPSFHFILDGSKNEWEHTCPELHMEGPGSELAKMPSSVEEAMLILEMFMQFKIGLNSMTFVKRYLDAMYGETMTKATISANIVLFQRYLASRRQGNQCIERFERELKKHCEFEGLHFDEVNYERLLVGATWIDKDWPSPAEFNMFLVDGISKFMCREYHLIPILGIAQDFTLSVVCVAICHAESKEALSRMFDYLEKRDPSIWNREVFVMSDGGSGIRAALAEKKLVHHRFCLVHKSANLFNHMNQKGVAALGVDLKNAPDVIHQIQDELMRAVKFGEKHSAAWGLDFEQDNELRVPYQRRTFSAWDDRYAQPDLQRHGEPMAVLNWLRTAPTLEELARRLKVYLSKDPERRQLHTLALWKTRRTWWQGALSPLPDYGVGTNNACESFLGKVRKGIPPSTELDTLHECIAAVARSHNVDLKRTRDGKQAKKLGTHMAFLPPSFHPLDAHLNFCGVTPFAKLTLFENIALARGLVPTVFEGGLEEEHIRALVKHSAFAIRFAHFHMENVEDGLIQRTIRVEDRFYQAERSRNYFVAVLECGSYICSCGETIQYGGIPCRHVCAALEAGFLTFNAYGNLDAFLLLPPHGEKVDLSDSLSSQAPEAAANFSVEPRLRSVDAMRIEPINVRRGARWNPWRIEGVQERETISRSARWATEEITLELVTTLLGKARHARDWRLRAWRESLTCLHLPEMSLNERTKKKTESSKEEPVVSKGLESQSSSELTKSRNSPGLAEEEGQSGDCGLTVGVNESEDASGASDPEENGKEMFAHQSKRVRASKNQISIPEDLRGVNVDDPMRPFNEAVYKVRELDSSGKRDLLNLFAEHLARYLNKDMSSMFKGNWGANKVLTILRDQCIGHDMAQFEEDFWMPCKTAIMHAAAFMNSPQKRSKGDLQNSGDRSPPKIPLARIPIRSRAGHSKNSPIEHAFNSGKRGGRRKKQET